MFDPNCHDLNIRTTMCGESENENPTSEHCWISDEQYCIYILQFLLVPVNYKLYRRRGRIKVNHESCCNESLPHVLNETSTTIKRKGCKL